MTKETSLGEAAGVSETAGAGEEEELPLPTAVGRAIPHLSYA